MEHLVCRPQELGELQCRLIRVDDVEIGVIRLKGRVYAYANRCVHQGGPVCRGQILGRLVEVLAPDRSRLEDRFSEDEVHIVCPWHGWEYDLKTGECVADRRLGLVAYPVEEREDGVYVRA